MLMRTEQRNPKSMHLDQMSTLEMVRLMNEENMNSVLAVHDANDRNIRRTVDCAQKKD